MSTASPSTEPTPTLPQDYASRDTKPINPWLFVPVLYLMQSIPNILVTETFVAVYKNLKVSNTQITFWTSIVSLPWTFKLFWGPLVDLNFTKRAWTLVMQAFVSASLIAVAAVIPLPHFFEISVAALFLIAMFSATHDIACDGLYLISLDKKRQASFSGVMATFSRLGRLFVTSALLYLAYTLNRHGWQMGTSWGIALGLCAIVYSAGMLWNTVALPRPESDVPAPKTEPNQNQRNIARTLAVVATGVCAYFVIASLVELSGYGMFTWLHGRQYDMAMALTDVEAQKTALAAMPKPKVPLNWHMTVHELHVQLGTLGGALLLLIPAWVATRRLVGNSPMGRAFSSYFRLSGIGGILFFIMFYRFGEAMVLKVVQLFLLDKVSEGGMGLTSGDVAKIYGLGVPFGLILGGLAGGAVIGKVGLRRAFWWLVICMNTPNLLYLWVAGAYKPDASLGSWKNLAIPFFPELALAAVLLVLSEIARRVYRRVQTRTPYVVCGILGLIAIALYGVGYLTGWAQENHTTHLFNWPLYGVAFCEALGYGFGFAGYFVYLMYVAQRSGPEFRTSHYAIGTGLGALFITFAGILSGIVQQACGYFGFFIVTCIFRIPGTMTLLFIPLDEEQPATDKV